MPTTAMRQAGFSSSVDKLRMREMSVFKRTIPGKSPARRIAAERWAKFKRNRMTRIYRSFTEPDRKNLTWEETWRQEDKGLIKNYEVGRALAKTNPELAEKAKKGELPVLGYKGGVEKTLKKKEKIGALNYIAKWQALRGEDLDVDLEQEIVLTCTRTNVKVTFTMDLEKLKNSI